MKVKYLVRKIAHKVYTLADNAYNMDPKSDGEYHFVREAMKHAPNDPICFDLGAAYGEWSMFAKTLRSDSVIHIFEPFPEMQKRLEARFRNDPRIILNNVAVSDRSGAVQFFQDTYSIHSRESVGRPGRDMVTVETIELDGYMKQNGIGEVFFMKMDIEGHEPFALRGAKEGLKAGKFKYIQFEYGGCNIDSRTYLKDFFDIFEGLPYRLGKLHPRHVEYVQAYDHLIDNFYDCNWIAERIH